MEGKKTASSAAHAGPPPQYLARPILLLTAISVAAYANTLLNGFVYDDGSQILNNVWIRGWRHLDDVFLSDVWAFAGVEGGNYYRPVMYLIYILAHQAFGPSPWGFHLVNVVLNCAVALTFFALAKRLLGRASRPGAWYLSAPFAAALLFALTPVHTEAVAWAGSVPELSFSLFYLASFFFYIKAAEGGPEKTNIALSALFFFLAALSKETALTLPLALACYDYARGRFNGRWYLRYLPSIAVLAAYFPLRLYALGGLAPRKSHQYLSALDVVISGPYLFAKYLVKLLLPVDLNVFHVFRPAGLWPAGVLSLAVAAAFLAAMYLTRKNSAVFISLSLIIVPLLPVLYVPVLAENAFAERYLYLPSSGFFMLAGLSLARLAASRGKAAALAALASVSIIYAAGTVARNAVWEDDRTLWKDSTSKSPGSFINRVNYGAALVEAGDVDAGIKELLLALEIGPDNENGRYLLGYAYYLKGMDDKAALEYKKTLEINPRHPDALNNLGVLSLKAGMPGEAARYFGAAAKARPKALYYTNMGDAYAGMGRMKEAADSYNTAISLDPDFFQAYSGLAATARKTGRIDEAIHYYRAALDIRSDANAHYNLGLAYMGKGMPEAALGHLEQAVRLKPGDPDYHNNLGIAYAETGDLAKAAVHFREAVRLSPDNPGFRKNFELLQLPAK